MTVILAGGLFIVIVLVIIPALTRRKKP